MTILDRYLWRTVLLSILITWLSLSLLFGLFDFLAEIGDLKPDSRYGTWQALLYVIYGLPRSLYINFPYAVLIGSLLGLGNLAANSEITAMRAAGFSIARIVLATLQLGLLLSVISFALGEWLVPRSETHAQNFKVGLLQQQVSVSQSGAWLKSGDRLISIDRVWSEGKLEGLSVYEVGLEGGIKRILKAAQGVQSGGQWRLEQVVDQYIQRTGVKIERHSELVVADLLPENILSIAIVKPEQLAANELAEFIQHQQDNALSSANFELEYWKHFTTPLSTLVMLVLAVPLVFGFQRNAGAGQRIFIGILIGISYLLLDRIISRTGLVYGLSPFWSAFLPLILFAVLGLVMLKRVR